MKIKKQRHDVIFALTFAAFVYLLFSYTDFIEFWYEATREYEHFELDELLGLVVGLLAGLLWITISRLKRRQTIAQRSARESDLRLHTIADQSPSIIFLKDAKGRYTFINRGFERLYGYREEQVLGQTLTDLLPAPEAEAAARHDQAAIAENRAVEREIVVPSDQGDRVLCTIKFPILDASGKLLGIGGLEHDITERKQAERAILAGKETAELADRAKSEFLANMSHELRTPLNAIIGFSRVMMTETAAPVDRAHYRDYAKDIHESGKHLLEVINDILDLSKVESAVDQLYEEEVEISEILRTARALVAQRAEKGGIGFVLDCPPSVPKVRADRRKLKQILINLLTNAIKFTEPGGTVTLRISCGEDGHVFEVIDTGIGMAAEDIPKAMAPFQQIESDLNRRYEGTGLGLPLTKGLTELHGGLLQVESTPGVGTTMTVRMPAARIVLPEVDSPADNADRMKAG